MQSDVSIVACGSYDPAECRRAMEQVLAPLGGLDWVSPGMRIVIKVNLVSAMKPEEAATTHPALLCALIELLKGRGASVVLGDSPGGLYNAAHLTHVYDAAGMRQCEAAGAALNMDFSQKTVENPNAAVARRFTYTAYLDGADAVIDFCKLKSHGMMGMTNAVKNFFGVIPGTMKPEYHYQYPKAEDFAGMLVDLAEYFAPRLCICDAVVGMEGNGPTQGTPRKIGALAASASAHKLDLACAAMLGMTAGDVPTLRAAVQRGLCPEKVEDLRITGDLSAFLVPDFQAPKAQGTVFFGQSGGLLGRLENTALRAFLTPKPLPQKKTCIGCAKCARICPAKAIKMQNKLPNIDRKACIHCFCCQEFCPVGAMKVYRSPIARLLNR